MPLSPLFRQWIVISLATAGAVFACATGEPLTAEEMAALTGEGQTTDTTLGGTQTGVASSGGAAATVPNGPTEVPMGGSTTMPAPAPTVIIQAPPAGGTTGSGVVSVGGAVSGAVSGVVGSGMAGSGMFGSGMAGSGMVGSGMAGAGMVGPGMMPSAGASGAPAAGASNCSNYNNANCSTTDEWAVKWCEAIIACANGASCTPTAASPLCAEDGNGNAPCTEIVWSNGGFTESGYTTALTIAEAACK